MTAITILTMIIATSASTQPSIVKLFIEPRFNGNRNSALELTKELMKSCPAVVSITGNADNAELRLAITPGASTLYRATDGSVEHIFSARFTLSGLTKEVCSYLKTR